MRSIFNLQTPGTTGTCDNEPQRGREPARGRMQNKRDASSSHARAAPAASGASRTSRARAEAASLLPAERDARQPERVAREVERVFEQHRYRHRADAARHGGDGARDEGNLVKVDVA